MNLKKSSNIGNTEFSAKRSKNLSRLITEDPYLKPYENSLLFREEFVRKREKEVCGDARCLQNFAMGHEYFGLHHVNDKWIFREWAPNATNIYLTGDFCSWKDVPRFALHRLDDHGTWEISLAEQKLRHQDLYRLSVHWDGGRGQRIPSYARRVVQDDDTKIFNAQVWAPSHDYEWKTADFTRPSEAPIIYEAHVGMAQADGKIGSYTEFMDNVLPRIADAGYNTIQLMAIQEHPYYGSFGYHVSNYFAASSRFGNPEELKQLIDTAHAAGISVIMDLVHSHAVRNEVEGLSHFDGTEYQYFHEGNSGYHYAWDSRCFDYAKSEVNHFLLSNCRFWLDEYRLDGFRFDGITSMLYTHHGLEKAFTGYHDYFGDSVDEDAVCYLSLANKLIHELRPDALTIAEDMSGMPGIGIPVDKGGIGFDYRLGMGIPDHWIKLVKHVRDEHWHTGNLWNELTNRRHNEKTISYAESHDQALVGDQTLIFRLIGDEMYSQMTVSDENRSVERGVALHKMIRLITLATGGEGYLNFMGNEFGHPEWIDFPREGNNWSHHYARRQWHLRDDPKLHYYYLAEFDREIVKMAKESKLMELGTGSLLYENIDDQVVCFERSSLIFLFNFNPNQSFDHLPIHANPGKYSLLLDSDSKQFAGYGRLTGPQTYFTRTDDERNKNASPYFTIYLPTRTALILKRAQQ